MNRLKQIRFFSKNYPQLQGLRALPAALLLLIVTLWANGQQGPASDLSLPILAGLGCLALYLVIDQYYNRVYGKVKRAITHAEWLLTAACGALALAAFIIDTTDTLAISLLGLVFAATFAFTSLWYFQPAMLLFALNLILALLLAVLSLLPLAGLHNWWQVVGIKHSLLAFTLLFGVFGILGGVIAHAYFVRGLPAKEAK